MAERRRDASNERKKQMKELRLNPDLAHACEVAATATDNPVLREHLLLAAKFIRAKKRVSHERSD